MRRAVCPLTRTGHCVNVWPFMVAPAVQGVGGSLCWKGLRRPSTRRLGASRILPERGVPDPQSEEPEFQRANLQGLVTSEAAGCTSLQLVALISNWAYLSPQMRAALTKIASTPLPDGVQAIFVALAGTLER